MKYLKGLIEIILMVLLGMVRITFGVTIAVVFILIPFFKIIEFVGEIIPKSISGNIDIFVGYVLIAFVSVVLLLLCYKAGEEFVEDYKWEKRGTIGGFIKRKLWQVKLYIKNGGK